MNKIGFNIHGDAANLDRNKLMGIVDQLKAPWHLVMNDLSYAKLIVARHPETKVAYRWTPADNAPLSSWPSAYNFVDFALREFGGVPLYAVVSNEAGYGDELLTRTCEIIEYGCPKGLHLAVLGIASGQPSDPGHWERPVMRRLLELCDKWRELVVVALDEYWCGVVTSGFIGGAPKFIQPEEWPRNLKDVVQWHSGRFNLLLTACDEMVIHAPRLLIKEHGADDMDDIDFWARTLALTPPYENIRSWKSCWNQWRIWWPRWDSQKAYYEQLKYANDVIYANPLVEGVLVFAWASPDANWRDFDISQADDLHRMLIASSALPTPARKYEPNTLYVYSGADNFNIRTDADKDSVLKGKLRTNDTVRFLDVDAKEADSLLWQRAVVFPSLGGMLEIEGWIAVTDLTLEPNPDTQPEEPPAPIELFPRADLLRMAAIRAQIANLEAEYAAIWTKAAERAA